MCAEKFSTYDKALFGCLAKAYSLSVHSRLAGQYPLKGQCREIFDFWFFSWISFPQAPEYTIRAVSNFTKIRGNICSSRCTKWKKSSIIKVLIILFGQLWEEELTYRYIFAYKFTLRSQQPDIVPIICRRCHWRQWCTLTWEYFREFLKKFETVLMIY